MENIKSLLTQIIKQKLTWLILIIITLICYIYWPQSDVVMVTSVSSDGHYAVTSDKGKFLILWDLQKQKHKIISRNANIYSAYFIKNSDKFIWQDLNNIVHVQDVTGKEFLKFCNFPVYSQVMSADLKNYFATNKGFNIYKGYGQQQKLIRNYHDPDTFLGIGKPNNLALSDDSKLLLNSSDGFLDGVTLFNATNGKTIKQLSGNLSKNFATLSPDGKYVVANDENSLSFLWETATQKKIMSMRAPVFFSPKDFMDIDTGYESNGELVAVKFIDDQNEYFQFSTDVPYATLYSTKSFKPQKYFRLGTHPIPSISDYDRDQSIDTAPAANILVTGQDIKSGIIVYHFDPKKKTLEKIWVGNL